MWQLYSYLTKHTVSITHGNSVTVMIEIQKLHEKTELREKLQIEYKHEKFTFIFKISGWLAQIKMMMDKIIKEITEFTNAILKQGKKYLWSKLSFNQITSFVEFVELNLQTMIIWLLENVPLSSSTKIFV